MMKDKAVRRAVIKKSHKHFFYYYFPKYIEYAIAPFQEELFELTQKDSWAILVISAFRGSGKSTVLSMSHVIHSIITGKAKYVLIVSQNQDKARTLLSHIKTQLEDNDLLKKDLGPFTEDKAEWNAGSIHITQYDARITAISSEQSARGLRHDSHRPDLIILDDCEDQESVKTVESRNKLHEWVTGDLIPSGSKNRKTVVIGSILHPDGLIKRLQQSIDEGKTNGIYRMFPIRDAQGNSMWPGKFPDDASIEAEKKQGTTDRQWKIEYELIPVLGDDQVVKDEWIQYYDRQPDPREPRYRYTATGIDLAIREEDTSDYTAMVSGAIVHEDDTWKLYILPYPINERLNGPAIQERIINQSYLLGDGIATMLYIENVAFQQSMVDIMQAKGIPAEGVSPGGKDKRARLMIISALIKNGQILFPRGMKADLLIKQIVYFGMEKHDDLLDAFTMLAMKVSERERKNAILFPGKDAVLLSPPVPSQAEQEKSLDQVIAAEDNALRSGNTASLRQNADQLKEAYSQNLEKEYEMAVFRGMMSGFC